MELLLWAERRKLRRSKILWIAGFATVMVALIVFAQGQFTFYESRYIDGAGWFMTAAQSLATFYVLPAVIALLGSYMICREEQEDTLKSLRLIPVNEVKLTLSKMVLALVFSVVIYLLLFAITFLVEAVLHFEALSIGLVLGNLKTYLLDGIGVFFAISPIIALVARIKKGYWLALVFAEIYSFAGLFASMSGQLKTVYPMTAVFNISGYYDASMVQVFIGTVCEILRKESRTPIIMLTALDDDDSQLKGFDALADDYITKPFSMPVVMKHIEAVLRRTEPAASESLVIRYKALVLDADSFSVQVNGSPVSLTTREFEILKFLLENQGRVFTRDNLLDRIWDYDYVGDEKIINTHIKNIRKKLGVDYIETIRGVGYKIEKENQ